MSAIDNNIYILRPQQIIQTPDKFDVTVIDDDIRKEVNDSGQDWVITRTKKNWR